MCSLNIDELTICYKYNLNNQIIFWILAVKTLYTLFIRLILSLIIAYLVGLFFFKEGQMIKTVGLAGVMLVLAYLFEYTKKQDGSGS